MYYLRKTFEDNAVYDNYILLFRAPSSLEPLYFSWQVQQHTHPNVSQHSHGNQHGFHGKEKGIYEKEKDIHVRSSDAISYIWFYLTKRMSSEVRN